ncbi:MAG TPA: hypothetical protein VMT66_15120 [Steroidobacteraceae bacterium]|nr:hypothetical protein [Steroidobacteraceae bacterium]
MWSRWKKFASTGIGLLPLLWSFTGEALAQAQPPGAQPPSGDELHSMYCVEVLRAEIALQQHMISAATEAAGAAPSPLREHWIDTSMELLRRLAQLEGTVYRLQLYMLPRIPGVDSLALAAAIRQANADIQESWRSETLLSRAAACENPPWLPP